MYVPKCNTFYITRRKITPRLDLALREIHFHGWRFLNNSWHSLRLKIGIDHKSFLWMRLSRLFLTKFPFVILIFLGDAESEGVRGPVSEAGNQLPEGRTPGCPKSMCLSRKKKKTKHKPFSRDSLWIAERQDEHSLSETVKHCVFRTKNMQQISTRTSTQSWASSRPKQSGTWAGSEINCN